MHPTITVIGTEEVLFDWLMDYCGEDAEQALDLYESAVLVDPEAPGTYALTVDFCLRSDR